MKTRLVSNGVALAAVLFALRAHSQDASDAAAETSVDATAGASADAASDSLGVAGQGGILERDKDSGFVGAGGTGTTGASGSIMGPTGVGGTISNGGGAGSSMGPTGVGGSFMGAAGSAIAGMGGMGPTGVGGSAGVATCVPGKTDLCACAGAKSGVQTCGPNGTFGSCDCTGTGTGGTSTGTTGMAAPTAADDSGCSCNTPGADASKGSVALVGLGALAWLTRGRRRSQRPSS
ncbi:MAG TPA: MYXO-CTERM sorting domain-containing protein [Ktedonobacterales bacterium]